MKTSFRLAALAALSLTLLPLLPVAPANAQYNGLPVPGYTHYSANPYRGLRRQQRNGRRYNNNRRTGTGATSGNRSNPTTKTAARPKADMATELGKLGLTAAQKSKIGIYQAKADADGKAAYADRSLSQDQFIARMDKIHDDLMASIDGVLTGEQKTKFDAAMAKEK